jgi:hypothetical protein
LRKKAITAWPQLDGLASATIQQLAEYALRPESTDWPTEEMPPPDNRRAMESLQLALCLRPQQWMG